ncbi:MAG: conserved rane protein of unknown function [Nitrospira sp.]|nr:conserved rane protein of unknown function [Nitrospira sp.]
MNAASLRFSQSLSQNIIGVTLDVCLLGFILNLTLQPLVEPDLGWHLRAGLDLIAQGWKLPETDPYSHTMPDWHWVEHAWLTDGLLALVYRSLGSFAGLGIILLFGCVTGLAWWIASAPASVHRTYRLAAMVISLWVALPFLGARTQLVSLLGVAVFFRVWNHIQQGHGQWIWILPPIFLLWANLHGGFTAGLFLFGLMLLLSFVMRMCLDRWPEFAAALDEPVLRGKELRRGALALLFALAATLLNPYGWGLYVEIYESLTDRFMIQTLREWQPVSFQGWAGRAYAFYLVALACLTAGWYRRVEPVRWVMLLIVLVLSLLHWRNVTLFLIVSLSLMAELLAAAALSLFRWVPALRSYAGACLLVVTAIAASVLYSLGTDHVVHVWRSGTGPEDYFEQTEYPIEAVRWIRNHREEVGTRLYNDYGFGGFLLWQLPDEKVFIDGRMPAWRIGDRRIFQDYVELNRVDSPALVVLDRYGIDWAVIERGSALALALEAHHAWKTLYADAKVVILRRRAGQREL